MNKTSEVDTWLAKYEPVERAIIAARDRRLSAKARRSRERRRAFGNLCEATGGAAVGWRRKGFAFAAMFELANGDAWTIQCLLALFRRKMTSKVAALQHAVARPLYYAAENARRQQLAAERRKITKRTTLSPCPTREQILDGWLHLRDSHAATLNFGSMVHDLECYLDNSLRRNEHGAILGRNGGVKAWLRENIPALALKYTTVMRYKAMAKKFKQIAEWPDPTPAAMVLGSGASSGGSLDFGADKLAVAPDGVVFAGAERNVQQRKPARGDYGADEIAILRARAIWLEVVKGVAAHPTALVARVEALVAPEAVSEATMLAAWKVKYANEITVRTKRRWVRRLFVNSNDRIASHPAVGGA